MTSTTAEHSKATEYRIVSVEQISPPGDMPGDWYRYIIQCGRSKIEGFQTGNLDQVTANIEKYTESLNERISQKIYTYGSRKK